MNIIFISSLENVLHSWLFWRKKMYIFGVNSNVPHICGTSVMMNFIWFIQTTVEIRFNGNGSFRSFKAIFIFNFLEFITSIHHIIEKNWLSLNYKSRFLTFELSWGHIWLARHHEIIFTLFRKHFEHMVEWVNRYLGYW